MTAAPPLPGPAGRQSAASACTRHLSQADRDAPMPLWAQVKAALVEMIASERLADHARLPSEAALCSAFQVSRSVIREALSQMVTEGRIYRVQGKGAFVRRPREAQRFVGTTVGFSGELPDHLTRVERRVLRQEVTLPTPRIRRFLQIGAEDTVVAVDRVLSVDGIPRAIVRWAMPAASVPGLERMPLHNRSLYDTIARQFGVTLLSAERWIEALSLSTEEADLLAAQPGQAALGLESVATGTGVLEYWTAVYLTDRSRLHFRASSERG